MDKHCCGRIIESGIVMKIVWIVKDFKSSISISRGKTGFAIAINLMYGMASLSSTFALLLVTESSIKSKHVQKVSGVYLSNFWLSALAWDLFNFLLPCLLMLVSITQLLLWTCHLSSSWTPIIKTCVLVTVGVSGLWSGGLHRWQPPGGRVVNVDAVRLGHHTSHVPSQLPLLLCCYCLHTPHHLQHDLWYSYLSGRYHHDHPRWENVQLTGNLSDHSNQVQLM